MEKVAFRLNRPVRGITRNAQEAGFQDFTALAGISVVSDQVSPGIPKRFNGFTDILEYTRKAAYQSGYEAGLAAGRLKTSQSVELMRQEFVSLLQSYEDQYNDVIEKLQAPFLHLVIQIAEKIIGSTITKDYQYESFLTSQINRILSDFSGQRSITLRLNPTNLERLQTEQFLSKLQLPPQIKVKIIEDSTIPEIGCIIESSDYIVDITLNRQLELLYQELLNQGQEWKT